MKLADGDVTACMKNDGSNLSASLLPSCSLGARLHEQSLEEEENQ